MELSSRTLTSVSATGATQRENRESRDVPFPFLELPPELCLRILKHLARLITSSYYNGEFKKNVPFWENAPFASQSPRKSCYGELRLLCRAVNDLIEKNRGTLGGLRAKRLIIGQVKIETSAIGPIVSELRKNRIKVTAMVFYGVEFACEASSLVDLFDVSDTTCVVMIECQLSAELEDSLLVSLLQQRRLKTFFIGSPASFEVYMKSIISSEDWIKRLLESTLSFVSDTLGRTQVTCFHSFSVRGLFYHVHSNPVERIIVTRYKPTDSVKNWFFVLNRFGESHNGYAAVSNRTTVRRSPPYFY